MPDIVISEFMDEDAVCEGLKGLDVLYDANLVERPDELATAVAHARALIVRNRTQVRGALLESAAKLRVVGRLGVGLDNIDVESCRGRGIAVHPASGANDVAVARGTASRAAALGMSVAAHDPYVGPDDSVWTPAWGRVEPLGLPDLLAA